MCNCGTPSFNRLIISWSSQLFISISHIFATPGILDKRVQNTHSTCWDCSKLSRIISSDYLSSCPTYGFLQIALWYEYISCPKSRVKNYSRIVESTPTNRYLQERIFCIENTIWMDFYLKYINIDVLFTKPVTPYDEIQIQFDKIHSKMNEVTIWCMECFLYRVTWSHGIFVFFFPADVRRAMRKSDCIPDIIKLLAPEGKLYYNAVILNPSFSLALSRFLLTITMP